MFTFHQLNVVYNYEHTIKMLDSIEAVHMSAVLAECTDQLAILGRIMPVSFQNRPDAEQVRTVRTKIINSNITPWGELL